MTAINEAAKKLLNNPIKEDLDKYLTRCEFPLIGEPKSRARAAPFSRPRKALVSVPRMTEIERSDSDPRGSCS